MGATHAVNSAASSQYARPKSSCVGFDSGVEFLWERVDLDGTMDQGDSDGPLSTEDGDKPVTVSVGRRFLP